jgi:NADP-reducing hydrogenase subunit HndB
MTRIQSLESLYQFRDELKTIRKSLNEMSSEGGMVKVKVAMATCSIAAGASEILTFFTEALDKRGIDALVTKTGCMGYCYAEPTVEVTVANRKPVVFGDVDLQKADLIIEKYIKQGEMLEGTIPANYKTIDELYK